MHQILGLESLDMLENAPRDSESPVARTGQNTSFCSEWTGIATA